MHLLFQASAGSGKTYQLSLHYLKLLKTLISQDSSALREILATTFTNKAVYEMKERIISFLKEIAKQSDRGEKLSAESGLTAEEAEKILEEIFLHYDYLEIKTIDSFLLKLFRGLAYELNLPPKFVIKSSIETSHLEKTLLKLFERANKEKEVWNLLERFTEFLLTKEKVLTLNFKVKLLNELNRMIELSTYKEELLLYRKSEVSPSEDNVSSLRGYFYFKLWSYLKEELEKVLLEAGHLYLGIWKEKLAYQIKEDFLPWIYLKLGNLQAFIIDEFQDTDKLQWNVLTPLVEDLISQGKSLIIAGDTKQCLYRWKGGDPALMREVKEKLNPYNLNLVSLSKNFRSCGNLVTFCNEFFSLLKENLELKRSFMERLIYGKNPEEEIDEELIEVAFSEFDELFAQIHQSASKNLKGKVIIDFIDLTKLHRILDNEIKQRYLFQKIEEILQELEEKGEIENTAILLRENKDISELSSYLVSRGYKIIGSSLLKLKESSLLNTLLAYIKLLSHPEDEIAIATVLLGILQEKGRYILAQYQKLRPYKSKSFTLKAYLEEYEKEIWKSTFEVPLNKGYFLNLYQFIRYLVYTFELEDKFPEERPFLNRFLSFILGEISAESDYWSILSNWESLSEREGLSLPQEKEAIQILTIHLSKGLEFQNVILPLNFNYKYSRSKPSLFFTEDGIYRGKKEELPASVAKIYYLEKIQQAMEVFNLLYVAFTRAIKNLYILVPMGPNFLVAELFVRAYEVLKERGFHPQKYNFLQERLLVPYSEIPPSEL